MACLYIKILWSSYYDVTSVEFKMKEILEDKIFDRQDILQFFSEVSKDYKFVNIPKHEIDTLTICLFIIMPSLAVYTSHSKF